MQARHDSPFQNQMRRLVLAILLLVLPSLPLIAQQLPPIGIIDFYGLRTLPESAARAALGVREGDPVPDSAGPATRRLRALPNVADARLNLVCCSNDGKAILFVGIAESGAAVRTVSAAPAGSIRLPDDIVQLGRAFDDTLMAAIRQGKGTERDSAGHAFFDYPGANAIQHRYLAIAATRLPLLRDVLAHSASAEHRALAAELLGYAPRVADVVSDLESAIHDPDEAVRNNAMRALAVIAFYAQQSPLLGIRVSPKPFLEMLNSLVWTDRNKASLALLRLTTGRDPTFLALLRAQALPALVDIARWRSAGHAYAGYMTLGRVEGIPEDSLEQAWIRGDRSAVLDSVARMVSPAQAPRVELDHVYIVVQPGGAKEIAALRSAGFQITPPQQHEGEGTTSVAALFDNAYVELMWLDSTLSVTAEHAASARQFRDAADWRVSRHSPFGIGLRRLPGETASFPFPIKRESAPWIDSVSAYEILNQPSDSLAVDLFVVPNRAAVPTWIERVRKRSPHLLAHPGGGHRITAVRLHGTIEQQPSTIRHLRLARVETRKATEPLLEIYIEGGVRKSRTDLRPALPVVVIR